MKYAIASVAALSWAIVEVSAAVPLWGQCGGINYTGETTCVSGAVCTYVNDWYSQCLQGTASSASSASRASSAANSASPTASTCPSSTPAAGSGTLSKRGVNIAGFDFGCTTDGACDVTKNLGPLPNYGGPDGPGQMQHFRSARGHNTFRLPVGWQYLTPTLGGTLNSNNWGRYRELVSACLNVASDVTCIIDIHNYARWNGGIIGQGGPTNDQFASLWRQIAQAYASEPRVWFGIVNEPHDIPSITTWAASVQAAVTAIRNAGATRNTILLPGNDWTSAQNFVSNGSGAALNNVVNADGTKDNLIFDVHKYLDSDNSGTHTECVTNNIDSTFAPLAQWLRCHGRKAILTETGGGNVSSCLTYVCQQNQFLAKNSDVFVGVTGWSAGSFDYTYELTLTPTKSGSTWTDTALISAGCFF